MADYAVTLAGARLTTFWGQPKVTFFMAAVRRIHLLPNLPSSQRPNSGVSRSRRRAARYRQPHKASLPPRRPAHPEDPFAELDGGRRDALLNDSGGRASTRESEAQPTLTSLARAVWETRSHLQTLRAEREQDRRRVDSIDQTNLHLQVTHADLGAQLEVAVDRLTQL